MNLSIIIPIHNEKNSLRELIKRCHHVCRRWEPFELICVDDGSIDGSFETLLQLKQQYNEIRIIKFPQNYGKSAALDAGFRHAAGKIFVTIDADLQNPPEEIPKLLHALENADAAIGWRIHRMDPIGRKLISRLANYCRNAILRDHAHDSACGLKAFHRHTISDIQIGNGMHRFLPILIMRNNKKIVEVKIQHQPRLYGQSKYTISKKILAALIDTTAVLFHREKKSYYKIELMT